MESRNHAFYVYQQYWLENRLPWYRNDIILKEMKFHLVDFVIMDPNFVLKLCTIIWATLLDAYDQMFTLVLVCNITLCCKVHNLFSFMFTILQFVSMYHNKCGSFYTLSQGDSNGTQIITMKMNENDRTVLWETYNST